MDLVVFPFGFAHGLIRVGLVSAVKPEVLLVLYVSS
jgi:hypothetical protein